MEIPKANFTMQMIMQHECLHPYVARLQLPESTFIFLVEAIANLNALNSLGEGLTEIQVVEGVLLLCAKVAEKEREACAKIAYTFISQQSDEDWRGQTIESRAVFSLQVRDAIRARGENHVDEDAA